MINNIVLKGEIIKELTSLKKTGKRMILAVSRRSGVIDNVPIIVELSQAEDLDIQVGCRVHVEGAAISFHENGHLQLAVLVDFIMKIDLMDEKDKNIFKLSGSICKEPSYRITKKDVELTCFMMACRDVYVPVVAFFQNALFLKECSVGYQLEVTGRLQSRTYIKVDETTHEEVERREYMELAIKELLGVDVN